MKLKIILVLFFVLISIINTIVIIQDMIKDIKYMKERLKNGR